MTTTPEACAKRIIERTYNSDELETEAKVVAVAYLSERQAREAAESDAENLAHRLVTTLNRAEAAEKEVERLRACLTDETDRSGRYAVKAGLAEAKLAALVEALEKIADAEVTVCDLGRYGGRSNDQRMCWENQTRLIANEALAALRPSPISHETKALVLAAADAAAEGSTAIAPVENGERGSVQILCEEIGFPFSPDLERPEVLVRFVGELIVEIEHHASIRSAVAKALGKETEAGPEDEVLAMAVQMIAAPDNRSRIATAMALHGLCDERNPEDAYPTNHTIDMLSSCASAIRFGLEPRVQGIGSRHAAEAASHVWRQVYGIKLFDQHTGGWSKSWARHKLEVATGRLVAGESVNGPVPVGASAAATNKEAPRP